MAVLQVERPCLSERSKETGKPVVSCKASHKVLTIQVIAGGVTM